MDTRAQAIQICSLIAQIETVNDFVGMPLRLATTLMFLASQDPMDKERLLEALERLHYI